MDKRDDGDLNEYPHDLKEDYNALTNWLSELSQKYREKIRIEIVNASSFRGFYKSIRHWTQTYPTFIVNKKAKYSGTDRTQLDLILQSHMSAS